MERNGSRRRHELGGDRIIMYQVNAAFSILKALTPVTPFRNIAERFPLFMQLVLNNLSAKFRKSRLGFLWLFIPHLCILFLYIYVFSHIFKMKWPESAMESNWSFGLSIYTGIVLYSLLSDSIMESISSIAGRVNYVKKIHSRWICCHSRPRRPIFWWQ